MNDYADDPFKAMTRKYDAAVMEKGGASIFSLRRPVMVVPNAAPKHVKRAPAPPRQFGYRWHGKELQELREAWAGPDKEQAIADRFRTSRGAIRDVAERHGFPKRNRKQLPGRIVGGLTGALGGWASDIDDREFGA